MGKSLFAKMSLSGSPWARGHASKLRCWMLIIFTTLTINGTLAFAKSDCDSILQYGIYDLSTKESDETFIQKTIDFLEKRHYQSFEQAKSDASSLGIDSDDFGLDYGQSGSSSSSSQVEDYLKKLKDSNTDIGKRFREYNKKASPVLAKAWEKCVINRTGPVVWAVRLDDTRFQLKAAAYPQGATRGQYFFDDVTAKPANCEKQKGERGALLPDPDNAFAWNCSQSNSTQSISIILKAREQGSGGKKHPVNTTFILKPIPPVPVGIASGGAQKPVCADVASVVGATYKRILNRTDNERDGFWKVRRQLKEHEITVRDLVKTLASSQEFNNRVFSDKNARNRVKLLYPILLGREASEFDADHHAANYSDMETKKIVAMIVADGGEYTTRFGHNIVPDNPPVIAYCE